jgi:type I restriction enzyme S subunit
MKSNEWEKIKLKNISDFKYGKMPKKEKLKEFGYPIYSGYRVTGFYDEFMYKERKLILVARGVGGTGDVKISPQNSWITNLSIIFELNLNLVDFKYLYYKLSSCNLRMLDSGSAQSQITIKDISEFEINLPPLATQKKIAHILSSIDNKIENNNKIIDNLEQQSQALYKYWFVDFEFPDENGKPYKSSGGKMIEVSIGLIPSGWLVKKLSDFLPVVTGKKNANVATNNGQYKFFTCSKDISLTDDFSFEGEAILLAGNGDFNVKYYSGKFEAYQRTYVLIPENRVLIGFLYELIKLNLSDITLGHRGSVIKFITKGMIEDYKFAYSEEYYEYFIILKNNLSYISQLNLENEKLVQFRNYLLPKLMNGEIELD